ncbi:MAG: hypothetical protein LLG06_09835 [Desulfobacteraceae bacterium]|nr:hypothetical protein [Desulfobacteraceae bacterium]
MMRIVLFVCGLCVGAVGFLRMAFNPLEGTSALLLAGFLLMRGMEKGPRKEGEKPKAGIN